MPQFSVIIPVYNRPSEVEELLASLALQTCKDFEVVIVEDGSSERCHAQADRYHTLIDLHYFYNKNAGRSIARNFGMEQARGDYFIFFDSDCIIPPTYFELLKNALRQQYTPCFGGPDTAHPSFSKLQKAINYSMTSLLTTGGVRGGKVQLEKFTPRTFNMGFSRAVWLKVGGFREMFSEDIDMSTRIKAAGFSIALIRETYVYHKRRVNLRLFFRQMHIFGMSRIKLFILYPNTLKAVHFLPAIFVIGVLATLLMSLFLTPWWALPLGLYTLALFISALISTHNLHISILAVITSYIQLIAYGLGFLHDGVMKLLLHRHRSIEEEIRIRNT